MRTLLTLCLLAFATLATAAPRADKVSWKDGGKDFDGYLVWDDATSAKRPGLLMVPNWWGVTDAAIGKAQTIAGKDFVILLVDMYGREPRPKLRDVVGRHGAVSPSSSRVLKIG